MMIVGIQSLLKKLVLILLISLKIK